MAITDFVFHGINLRGAGDASMCIFFCTWCRDGGGEESIGVFSPHMVVVVTKFISSCDTWRPASKRYYLGSSPADATNLYHVPSNSTFPVYKF